MKLSYIEFNKQVDCIVTNAPDRSRIVAAAIALAVALAAPLPSSEVSDATNHYQMNVQLAVRQKIYAMNEGAVFDAKGAEELARQFWLLRYHTLFPKDVNFMYQQYGFFDTMMGVSVIVPPEGCEFVNQYKREIFSLVPQARCLVAEEEGNV